jgi:hypothetical protein
LKSTDVSEEYVALISDRRRNQPAAGSKQSNLPISEAMTLLVRHVGEDVLRLSCHVLTSYFIFSGQPYERIDGVAMSSPLFSVISRFFMEDFGEVALDGATRKPLFWFHYRLTDLLIT